MNGGGYPFHPRERDLSIEARIIAVADVFQALVQDRPYRHGLELREVQSIVVEQARSGLLDPGIVDLALRHGERCQAIAEGRDALCNRDYQRLLGATIQA